MYGVSTLRVRLPDLDSSIDRKSSDATTIIHHKPSIAVDVSPWDVDAVTGLPVATKENEWLGFCPCAVKLQNGDRKSALKKRTDYAASFAASGLTTFYCASKGCLFQGHTSVDFAFKTVMRDERLGIKCRWPFLAKSHVYQKSISGRQYHFQCPICIFTHGHAEGRVWKGIDIFIEHVATHRGKDLSPEVIHKLNIINDRSADEREDFDINLVPPPNKTYTHSRENPTTTTPLPANGNNAGTTVTPPSLSRTQTFSSFADSIWSRKSHHQSHNSTSAAGNELSRQNTLQRSDRADSVVSTLAEIDHADCAGCWSEGLSDFKMDREEDYLSPDF